MSLEQIANGDYFVSFPRSRGDEPALTLRLGV